MPVLNAIEKVVFVTSQQMFSNSKLVDYAQSDGYRMVVVPVALAAKFPCLTDVEGAPVRDLDAFYREWDESFTFSFVDPDQLDLAERAVFDQTKRIMTLAGRRRPRVSKVLISETILNP